MHASAFSYSLTRPYPYRWFTPVVIAGAVVFFVVFSVLTLPTAGYLLKPVYTTDLNATEATHYWFSNLPWSKLKATCQPQIFLPGQQFFTSNYGLTYTLKQIYPNISDGVTPTSPQAASLAYRNGPLSDCLVSSVDVTLRRADFNQPTEHYWWSWGDSSASATVNCTVAADPQPVKALFNVDFHHGPRDFSYIVQPDNNKSSSIWWGTRLADIYWNGILTAMSETEVYSSVTDIENNTSPIWTAGEVDFTLNKPADILGYDLFTVTYYLLPSTGLIENVGLPHSDMYNNPDWPSSTLFTESLSFARILYSLLLVDLGRQDIPNILLNETQLKWQLNATNDIFREHNTTLYPGLPVDNCQDCNEYYQIQSPINSSILVDMNASYAEFKPFLGPLGTSTATIFSQYSCTVPEAKDGIALILAVFLADIVFMSTLWAVFRLITEYMVRRHDAVADVCRGCLAQHVPLADLESPRGNMSKEPKIETRPVDDLDGESSRRLL